MTGRAVVRAIRKGLIKRVPRVREYKNWEVEFENGEKIEPDLIVFATGFDYLKEHLKEVVDFDPDGRPHGPGPRPHRRTSVLLIEQALQAA